MKVFNIRIILKISLLLIVFLCGPTIGKIIYVDDDATSGANDGSSWENAYLSLYRALTDAKSAQKPVEIRVAQGIYIPGYTSSNSGATFQLINGVTIAGGYAGLNFVTPIVDPNTRDVGLYETILSGDLADNDKPVSDPWLLSRTRGREENSYHVVTGSGTEPNAVLDGFTIRDGHAHNSRGGGMVIVGGSPRIVNCTFTNNSSSYYSSDGGGIFNVSSSNPTLVNCVISGNVAKVGGGMFNDSNSAPNLTNCLIANNFALESAGGMYNLGCKPTLTACTFYDNHARNGGAISNSGSDLIMTDCIVTANWANYAGDGICNSKSNLNLINCMFIKNGRGRALGGGIYNSVDSILTATSCSFSANWAGYGGGIYNINSDATISNCIFSGNKVGASSSGGMYIDNGSCNLLNCVFHGNLTSGENRNALSYSDVYDWYQGTVSSLTLINCILWNGDNEELDENDQTIDILFSNIQGGWKGSSNIDKEPLFAKPGYWADANDPNIVLEPDDPNAVWIDGDYHLMSQTGRYNPSSESWLVDEVKSPCINAGIPNTPIGEEPMPNGNIINMGAYGGTNEASMSAWQPELSFLIAHWTLDEGEGNIAYDNVSGKYANVNGGRWTTFGKIDGALSFDGKNDYVDCGYSRFLRPERMTLSMWIEPDWTDDICYIVSRGNRRSTPHDYALIRHPTKEIELVLDDQRYEDPISITSQAVTTTYEWSHVVICLSDSEASIYINGQFDSATEYISAEPEHEQKQNIKLGSHPIDGDFYEGTIDDFRIYNKVLDPAEILELAQ